MQILRHPLPAWVTLLIVVASFAIWFVGDVIPTRDRANFRLVVISGFLLVAAASVAVLIFRTRVDSQQSTVSPISTLSPQQKKHALIELETSRVLNLVRSRLMRDRAHSASIETIGQGLRGSRTSENVDDLLKKLARENARSIEDATRAQQELERAQATIEALRASLEKATEVALRDQLTAIGNRRAFDLYVDQSIASSLAAGEELSLIMADIDHFKSVNDRYGHSAGDEVIRLVADNLTANVRGSDFVCRYGGEEFAVILPRTSAADASPIAERIRASIMGQKLALRASGELLDSITASFGVTQFRRGEQRLHLLKRVDQALYASKTGGRNRVSLL